MIELYTWGTTNGRRPVILLEEAQIPYQLKPVNIQQGAQNEPGYAEISPFRKIPSMVDTDGPGGKRVSLFESAAILLYLAEKSGKFLGTTPSAKPDVLKWLIFSTSTMLPVFGLMRTYKDLEPTAAKHLDVLEAQLAKTQFLAGDYSIADMAPITRLSQFADHEWMKARPNVKRWIGAVAGRPAVKKALEMKIG